MVADHLVRIKNSCQVHCSSQIPSSLSTKVDLLSLRMLPFSKVHAYQVTFRFVVVINQYSKQYKAVNVATTGHRNSHRYNFKAMNEVSITDIDRHI